MVLGRNPGEFLSSEAPAIAEEDLTGCVLQLLAAGAP